MPRLNLLRVAILPFASAALLMACQPAAAPADSVEAEAVAAAVAPSAPAAAAASSLGTYAVGDTVVTLKDALVVSNADGRLKILLTPTVLTEEERAAVLAQPEWPGMSLMQKSLPEYQGRYPFVVATFNYEGELALSSVRTFYLMAFAIHEPNYTDNINAPVNENGNQLTKLALQDGRVSLAFTGNAEMGGQPRTWNLATPE